MGNENLVKRLVEIDSEQDIDNLKLGSVVHVKNSPMMVFSGFENEGFLKFYFHYAFAGGEITELIHPRTHIDNIGNMLAFSDSGYGRRTKLTPENGVEYTSKKSDLVLLGLMKE